MGFGPDVACDAVTADAERGGEARTAATVGDLARFELFEDADPRDLAPLAARLTPVRFDGGATVLRRGDEANSFLLMAEGNGIVTIDGEEDTAVGSVTAGSLVGELALLRGTPRMATVSAVTPMRGWAGDRAAFTLLREVPGTLDRVLTRARRRIAADLRPSPATLRDGTGILIRPVLPGDRWQLLRSGARASAETRYRRFFSAADISEHMARYLTEVDYVDHFVWVATDTDHTPLGGATYVRDAKNASSAEISISMVDEVQGRGLGTLLMGALAVAAREAGIGRFTGEVLAHNAPMRAILDRAGAHWQSRGDAIAHAVLDVPEPALFGLTPPLTAALVRLVREVGLRAWSSLVPLGLKSILTRP
jgi:CRP-like cAMP-binding protein